MNRPRYFQQDTYHHLYNRGAGKQLIFFDKYDYNFFIKRIKQYKDQFDLELMAYCLMPNHFHIFIRQTTKGNITTKFISNLTNSYTKSINKKYNRSGVLFQGRTANKIIYDENSFAVLVKYILMNPVKAKLAKKFYDWEYSSAKELLDISNAGVTDKIIMDYFKNKKEFIDYIESDNILYDKALKQIIK